MTKHEPKTCPRCGAHFVCKSNNPVHCDCAQVHLEEATLLAIAVRYSDCLCGPCLREIAAGAPPEGAMRTPLAPGDSDGTAA